MSLQPVLTEKLTNCNVLIFGQKGYGKTSLARGLMRNVKRGVILDTLMYEYTEEDGVICVTYEDVLNELKRIATAKEESFSIVARCPEDVRFFNLLDGLENTTFLIEEMDTFSDLHNIPESIAMHYKYGRHKQNNMIALSRHAQEISPEIRKQSDVVISFRQEEPNVLKYLAMTNYILTKKLPALKKGEYKILKGREYLEEFLLLQSGEAIELPKEDENEGTLFEKEKE